MGMIENGLLDTPMRGEKIMSGYDLANCGENLAQTKQCLGCVVSDIFMNS